MEVSERQNRIIRTVLSTENLDILKKVEKLLNKNRIIAYDTNGNPLNKDAYIKSINEAINCTEELTTDEVFKNIANAYSLE